MACNDFRMLSPNFGSSCSSAIARHALLPTFPLLWPFLFSISETPLQWRRRQQTKKWLNFNSTKEKKTQLDVTTFQELPSGVTVPLCPRSFLPPFSLSCSLLFLFVFFLPSHAGPSFFPQRERLRRMRKTCSSTSRLCPSIPMPEIK